jgi:hypothetical protein
MFLFQTHTAPAGFRAGAPQHPSRAAAVSAHEISGLDPVFIGHGLGDHGRKPPAKTPSFIFADKTERCNTEKDFENTFSPFERALRFS